jgi:hypothetical protein
MHSRLLAVLPYLLYGQALLSCPDSTVNLHSRCPVPAAHRPALSCSLSLLPLLSVQTFLLAVLSHLLAAQLLFCLCCLLSRLSCCYPVSYACCPDSPAAILPLKLAVKTLLLLSHLFCMLSRLSCCYPASSACCPDSLLVSAAHR